MAIVKIIRNSPALINGAMTVWDQTFMNRLISRRINVQVPSQFTRPKRRTPIWSVSIIAIILCRVLDIADCAKMASPDKSVALDRQKFRKTNKPAFTSPAAMISMLG
jgi:hypothetical protein